MTKAQSAKQDIHTGKDSYKERRLTQQEREMIFRSRNNSITFFFLLHFDDIYVVIDTTIKGSL